MSHKFVALDGSIKEVDLRSVFDVVLGYSARRQNWTATIIFDPRLSSFIELRSSPPDYQGNSAEEAEEVSSQYLKETFDLDDLDLRRVRDSPREWRLVNRR